MDLAAVEALLQYHFRAAEIAEEALTAAGVTKPSASSETEKSIPHGNKRLALLGDALIRLAVIDDWYPSGSSPAQGQDAFTRVGTNDALSRQGREQGLADLIVPNPCQQHSVPKSTLASSMEAIIGAVWIDSDKSLDQVQKAMQNLGIGCCSQREK